MLSKEAVVIQQEPTPIVPTKPLLNVTLSSDAVLLLGFGLWVLWDRLIRSSVVKKLDGVFAPIEEERALNNLLAQIGVITSASRVVLAAFHNGAINNLGYHLTKLSTINSYTAPGRLPMSKPIRDLPVGRIMFELEDLLAPSGDAWSFVQYSEDLPQPCKDHLMSNNIDRMYNRLVRIGNLPIGILSLQYDASERRSPPIISGAHVHIMEDLYEQVCGIMRRRIVHPGPLRRFLMLIGKGRKSPVSP